MDLDEVSPSESSMLPVKGFVASIQVIGPAAMAACRKYLTEQKS